MPTSEIISSEVLLSPLEEAIETRRAFSPAIFRRAFTAVEILADFGAAWLAVFGANVLYANLQIGRRLHYSGTEVSVIASVVGFLVVLLLQRDGAYRGVNSLLRIRETERVIRITGQTLLLFFPF